MFLKRHFKFIKSVVDNSFGQWGNLFILLFRRLFTLNNHEVLPYLTKGNIFQNVNRPLLIYMVSPSHSAAILIYNRTTTFMYNK